MTQLSSLAVSSQHGSFSLTINFILYLRHAFKLEGNVKKNEDE